MNDNIRWRVFTHAASLIIDFSASETPKYQCKIHTRWSMDDCILLRSKIPQLLKRILTSWDLYLSILSRRCCHMNKSPLTPRPTPKIFSLYHQTINRCTCTYIQPKMIKSNQRRQKGKREKERKNKREKNEIRGTKTNVCSELLFLSPLSLLRFFSFNLFFCTIPSSKL